MKKSIRVALLTGVGFVLGSTTTMAQMQPPPPPPDMYGSGTLHGRLADRALRDFDLNKDGKITKAEMDKAIAQRFSKASGGAQTMTEGQFASAHEDLLRDHANRRFRRIDWNADGSLSLDEFRAPLRARFERMDRDGSAAISCMPRLRRGMRGLGSDMKDTQKAHRRSHRRGRHHLHGALGKMCREADLNKDGKLTRVEFDKAVASTYGRAVKGDGAMTPAEFFRLEKVQFDDREARRFKRLDKNHDGKLTEAEFAKPGERLFARMDRNKDGVVTRDELKAPRHGHHRRGKKPR